MAGSVNKVILVGNLGRDPEVRTTQSGSKIVNLSLATSETWKDKNSGERRERTEWHRVVIFNEKLGEIAEKYLRKGSKIYLEGQLQTRKWTDQSGADKYSTEIVLQNFRGAIVMLGDKDGGQQAAQEPQAHAATTSEMGGTDYPSGKVAGGGDLDDEIPFAPMKD